MVHLIIVRKQEIGIDYMNPPEGRSKFRVLCLDGGGIRGAFTAGILAEIERLVLNKRSIVKCFDLIAGTSTGGIIAIALAFDKSPEDICTFYRERGPQIFPTSNMLRRVWLHIKQVFVSPYSPKVLQEHIEAVIGKHPLCKAKARLLIPSYNIDHGNCHVFKHVFREDRGTVERRIPWEAYTRFESISASELAVATAAAPTFFPAKTIQPLGGQRFIDGGVWANCPVLAAIAEATGPFGKRLEDICMLSVGTRFEALSIGKWKEVGGFVPWNTKVISLLMNAQAAGAVGTARIMLGEQFLRLDEKRDDNGSPKLSLDGVTDVPILIKRGQELCRANESMIRTFFEKYLCGNSLAA